MGHGVVAFRKMFSRDEFEAMPDDWRGELIMGELVMAPPPVAYHQHLVTELSTRVCNHLGEERWRVLVAPVNVNVDVYNVYQPDLIVLPAGGVKPSLDWEIPIPIWVVEILSPCPTYWRLTPVESMKFIEEEMSEIFPLGVVKDWE